MRAFLTLMLDVPREVRRKKSIISLALLLVMSLVYSICFRIETLSLDQHIEQTLQREILDRALLRQDLAGVAFADAVREVGDDDANRLPSRFQGQRATTVDFTNAETKGAFSETLALSQQLERFVKTIEGRSAIEVLVERTLAPHFEDVSALLDSEDTNRLHIGFKSSLNSFSGANYTIFFGSIEDEFPMNSRGRPVTPEELIDGLFSSWMQVSLFWIVILVIAAGFTPALLTRGNIEPILARPVSRATVLLGTYAGMVLLAALFFGSMVLLMYLGFSQTLGAPSSDVLFAIPGLTLAFACVVAGSTLAGTLIRANAFSSLAVVGLYIFPGILSQVLELRRFSVEPEDSEGGWVLSVMEGFWWVLPKVTEIQRLSLPEGFEAGLFRRTPPDPTVAIGTSIAFAGVCLTLAWLRARRMEF